MSNMYDGEDNVIDVREDRRSPMRTKDYAQLRISPHTNHRDARYWEKYVYIQWHATSH